VAALRPFVESWISASDEERSIATTRRNAAAVLESQEAENPLEAFDEVLPDAEIQEYNFDLAMFGDEGFDAPLPSLPVVQPAIMSSVQLASVNFWPVLGSEMTRFALLSDPASSLQDIINLCGVGLGASYLALAFVVVHKLPRNSRASVYGGILRDVVVRGLAFIDMDLDISYYRNSSDGMLTDLLAALRIFVRECPSIEISPKCLSYVGIGKDDKGPAVKPHILASIDGNFTIEFELVDSIVFDGKKDRRMNYDVNNLSFGITGNEGIPELTLKDPGNEGDTVESVLASIRRNVFCNIKPMNTKRMRAVVQKLIGKRNFTFA
jgi:hypothetical protein